MARSWFWAVGAVVISGCGVGTAPPPQRAPGPPPLPPALPDSTGFGTHVLALRSTPAGALWVGTYGKGIYMLRPRTTEWQRIASRQNDSTSISWNFVNSLELTADTNTVWYGTVGNGWGVSTDGGRSWRNWTYAQLGPEWQYVAPDGIRTRGDTVYIATADGLRISGDNGNTWRCIRGSDRVSGGAAPKPDACNETVYSLPTEYLLSIDVTPSGQIWLGHLRGVSLSTDRGETWTTPEGLADAGRVRSIAAQDSIVWIAGEDGYYRRRGTGAFAPAPVRAPGFPTLPGRPRLIETLPGGSAPVIGLSAGLAGPDEEGVFHVYYLPAGDRYRPASDVWALTFWGSWPVSGTGSGLTRYLAGEFDAPPGGQAGQPPADPQAPMFARPILPRDGNPYIDATYRYGSTMGGNFQQHQGVEFNNPAGTQVRAIGDGVVVFAGPAEAGANTVAIRHDQRVADRYIFSVYYHNSSLAVTNGQRVRAGDVIARVGNTGRATNDHLHLEVHASTVMDSNQVVDPAVRFPPHTTNPQLWLEPLPGTGIVAGRVLDAAGNPVQGARIYGLVQPYPEETPFSFVETYRDRAHSHPLYGENFAVGDVPAGSYTLGVDINGTRVWRRVLVQPGRVTIVEFRP